ncbi:RING-type domain-containing protein [Plasmodiophora brassicae]|uniref:RING-type E3 ubiquitin transferase n=1 Tax=Plasmodiophora brassicae TaxID=37360 RepID=A0A0G4J8W1_PLABS|nr:hypothetical protein PBRA_009572 [Plasmodiophora brassicae]SPQ98389.1 unnamed protein product [Plasmodiophora brassicae]
MPMFHHHCRLLAPPTLLVLLSALFSGLAVSGDSGVLKLVCREGFTYEVPRKEAAKFSPFLADMDSKRVEISCNELGIVIAYMVKHGQLEQEEQWRQWADSAVHARSLAQNQRLLSVVRDLQMQSLLTLVLRTTLVQSTLSSGQATTEDAIINDDELCAICHEPMRVGEDSTYLSCAHQFHTSCFLQWLNTAWEPTCPLCCRSVDTDYHIMSPILSSGNPPPSPMDNDNSPPISSHSTRCRSFWCCWRP